MKPVLLAALAAIALPCAAQAADPVSTEVEINGKTHFLLLNAFPISATGHAGAPVLGLVVIDTTKSKQAERRLA